MAFGSFKTLEDVLRTYQVQTRAVEFIRPLPIAVDERFRERLEFHRRTAPVSVSEEAICEFLIAPILQEAWRSFSDSLMIWSHVSLSADPALQGFPDYFFAKRSPLGPVRDKPYVMFVEAKKDDFDAAWAQCLAAMLAGQQLNRPGEEVVFGGVSNGAVWYFAMLQENSLSQDPRAFTIDDLSTLFAALNYVLGKANEQATSSGGLVCH